MHYLKISLLGAAAAALSVACVVNEIPEDDGSEGAGASEGSGSSGSGESSSSSGSGTGSGGGVFECCINGTGYTCPDEAAVNQCIGFDIDGCMSACGFDDFDCQDACFDQFESSTPDPSACTQDASATCNGGGGGGGGGGLCVGSWDGTYCDTDSDCSSSNCVNDKCYASDNGNPCDTDSDCNSSNCFEGCCYSGSAGSPCDTDSDCDSSNCYNNTCQ